MKTFRFLDFSIYDESKLYYRGVIKLLDSLGNKYRFNIVDQLRRSSLSVILNIAEGSAKKSDKDFARFLEISIASLNETVACLDVLFIEKQITLEVFDKCKNKAESIAKQLGSFIKKLRKPKYTKRRIRPANKPIANQLKP